MEIKGTTAIITGATGKIGRVFAMELARAGCDCVCHYHNNGEAAAELVEQVHAMGQKAVAVQADLTCEGQIVRLFEAGAGFGPIAVLINSASIFPRQKISDVTFDEARRIIDINLTAQILVCKEFGKRLLTPLIGKIVNIVDVAAMKGWAEYSVYCASKAGLVGLTKSLAKEFAPRITVNAVAPGMISEPEGGQEELRRQLKMVPMNRLGTAEEVAAAIMFLLRNDYVTGQVISVDGGRGI